MIGDLVTALVLVLVMVYTVIPPAREDVCSVVYPKTAISAES
jgi:hypothetical protein